jgi:protein-S-isoprenylcysteine O-methyltransferase Ste14
METKPEKPAGLIRMMVVRSVSAFLSMAALFFLPAWTLHYWQAWVFLLIIFIPMLFIVFYFLKSKPDFLVRRMNMKEKASGQSLIVKLSFIPLMLAFILPGFDVRLGWSNLPTWLVLASDLIVLLNYGLVFLAFRENSFASRIVEIMDGQKVINTGPYKLVRHPMYLGSIVMYAFSPLALGSVWAALPALFMIPVLVARIIGEEKMLVEELPGYADYTQKVRYRLIPGIW